MTLVEQRVPLAEVEIGDRIKDPLDGGPVTVVMKTVWKGCVRVWFRGEHRADWTEKPVVVLKRASTLNDLLDGAQE